MEKECAIEFKQVSKIYSLKSKDKKHLTDKRFYALKKISFRIPKGEVNFLVFPTKLVLSIIRASYMPKPVFLYHELTYSKLKSSLIKI